MSRRKIDPLREIALEEHQALVQLNRSTAAPAVEVARAKDLLAVGGDDYRAPPRPTPSAVAPVTRSRISSPVSTLKALPP